MSRHTATSEQPNLYPAAETSYMPSAEPLSRSNRKTSAAKAARSFAIVDRRRKVMLLKRAGWEQQEIAAMLGVSEATVSDDVAAIKAALQLQTLDNLVELVGQEASALDEDEAAVRNQIEEAREVRDINSLYETINRIRERRARLLGLDAALRSRDQNPTAALDAILNQLIEEGEDRRQNGA